MNCATAIDVSIVVVSYNTRALTLACLDSIAVETRRCRYEVHVVDNASSDGSTGALRNHAFGSGLIAAARNLGFAGANNIAARCARGEFILLSPP